MGRPSFLDSSAQQTFAAQGRNVERRIFQQFPEDDASNPVPLVQHLLSRVSHHLKKERFWFEGIVVTVQAEDGMTWSAESVLQGLLRAHPTLQAWCVSKPKRPDALPAIAERVGSGRFLTLAAAHGLADSYVTWRSWRAMAVLGLGLVLGIAAQFFANVKYQPTGQAFVDLFTTPGSLLVSAAAALAGIAGLFLHSYLTSRTYRNAVDTFNKQRDGNRPTDAYREFIDDLVTVLGKGPFPRLVVIDDYGSVDWVTQDVFARYFLDAANHNSGSELWVAFETPGSATFARNVLRHRKPEDPRGWGYRGTSLWEQAGLTEPERRELLKTLGRDQDEAVGLFTVKLLCEGTATGEARIHALAGEHRKLKPRAKTFTALDLLHVLSLTGSRVSLDIERLLSGLSAENRIRSRVLAHLLGTAQTSKTDFRRHVESLPKAFPTFAHVERQEGAASLRIGPEVAAGLADSAGELQLPDLALAHAFWSMYWFDYWSGRLDNQPTEAFWMDVLSSHVSKASLGALADAELHVDATNQLFEIGMYAAKGCLFVGLFRNVPRLLTQCSDLMSAGLRHDAAKRDRFIALAWEAYSVLGDDTLLSLMLQHTPALPGVEAVDREPPAMGVFVDSLKLPEQSRETAKSIMLAGSPSSKADSEAIVDYAHIRATWLALRATPFGVYIPHLALREVAAGSDPAARARAAIERLTNSIAQTSAPEGSSASPAVARVRRPALVDLISVSLGLWCLTLKCRSRSYSLATAAVAGPVPDLAGSPAVVPDLTASPLAHLQAGRQALRDTIDIAESAALLARDVDRLDFKRKLDTDFLREGLTPEISVVALASAVAAWLIAKEDYFDADLIPLIPSINGIAKVVSETLKYRIPEIDSPESLQSKELLQTIDSLLRMCALIWRKMDVTQLAAFMVIRRLAFSTLHTSKHAASVPTSAALELTSTLSNRDDYAGVMANLEMADHLQLASELTAYYLEQAARHALKSEMGEALASELALIALFRGQTFAMDATPFVRVLTLPTNTHLITAFQGVSDKEVPTLALSFFNISVRVQDAQVSAAFLARVRELTAHISSPAIAEEVERFHDLWAVRNGLETLDAAAISPLLERWQPCRNLWLYPWMLMLLLDGGHDDATVAREAALVLDRDPHSDRFTTYFNLALSVGTAASHGLKVDDGTAIEYLARGISFWEKIVSVEQNLRAYFLLAKRHDLDAVRYLAEAARWQQIQIEREHVRRLPQLVERREFFLLFEEYYNLMERWGLQLDTDEASFVKRLRYDEKRKRSELEQWEMNKYSKLVPVRDKSRAAVVSADFLCLGAYLFNLPLVADASFDEHRRVLNALAKKHLSPLLDAIRAMPDVPPFIKQVFDMYSRQLQQTLPA